EVLGFNIMNKQLGRCLQVKGGRSRGRVTLEVCNSSSALQEWQWHPDTLALSSLHTGKCLSVFQSREHDSIRMQSCGAGRADGADQGWRCTREGDVVLKNRGLYLASRHSSTKVYLSKEHGSSTVWKSQSGHTICSEHHGHRHPLMSASPTSGNTLPKKNKSHRENAVDIIQVLLYTTITDFTTPSLTISPPEELSTDFFDLENGMTWKVTMLILSSLALVIGLVILLLNIHYNRKKKVVCVLKSVSRSEATSQPSSPVPSERAPLTQHSMRPPNSPSLQRGEILIEWKDGTVTPLFDNSNYLMD
ncbi:hypothetical protein GN956_G19118, partial [Arapaima gigas]